MTEEAFRVNTSEGDLFEIKFITYDKGYFSEGSIESSPHNIEVVSIDLTRIKGNTPATLGSLSEITNGIATFFLKRKNVVICYYCDFLGPIPHTNKKITCQAYRNKLFSLLFKRYISKFNISGVIDRIITIHGVEDYFVHIIYRQQHEKYVNLIAHSIHEGYDKP